MELGSREFLGFQKQPFIEPSAKPEIETSSSNGNRVSIAVVKPLKFYAPLAMTASGMLRCGVATIRQWLVWAVRVTLQRSLSAQSCRWCGAQRMTAIRPKMTYAAPAPPKL